MRRPSSARQPQPWVRRSYWSARAAWSAKSRPKNSRPQHGYVIVPPYNDEKIIAGQGTMGLEILEDLPEVETVLVPVGGGGMISGIATAIKLSKPSGEGDRR